MRSYIRNFFRSLYFGAARTFSPDEAATLEAFAQSLPVDIGRRVGDQIKSIELIKKDFGGKVSQFIYPENLDLQKFAVPNERDIAAASLLFEGNRADIFFSGGHIVAIEFNPGSFEDDRRRDGRVISLCDLHQEKLRFVEESVSAELSSLLGRTTQKVVESAVYVYRQAYLERIQCQLPDDYLRILALTDSFECDFFYFEGTQSKTIPWPDVTIQALAVHQRRPLMLGIEDVKGAHVINLIDLEDKSRQPLTGSFMDALVRLENTG